MNKRNLLIGTAVAVLAVAAAVFVVNRQGTSGKEDQVIRLGAVICQTGDLSFFGQSETKAISLFQRENPQIKILIEDSRSSPKDALAATQRLVSQDVKFYLGSISFIVNTIDPVLLKEGAFGLSLSMDTLKRESASAFLPFYVSFASEMDALVELALAQRARKVGVLHANVDTMNHAVDSYLRRRLSSHNIQLVTQNFELSSRDLKNQLLMLSQQQPDILRILDFGDKLPNILRQAEETQLLKATTFVSGIETLLASPADIPDRARSRFVFTIPELYLSDENPLVKNFLKEKGENPNFHTLLTYDALSLMKNAIDDSKGDPAHVRSFLTEIQSFQGHLATYTRREDGALAPKLIWARFVNGQMQPVEGNSPSAHNAQ